MRRYATGVPARLGPPSFIVLIDDLRAACELSELIPSTGSASNVIILTWTANNDMQISTSKTKEIIIGSLDKLSPLSTSSGK